MYFDAGKTEEFYFLPTITYENADATIWNTKELQIRFLKFYIGFWWTYD